MRRCLLFSLIGLFLAAVAFGQTTPPPGKQEPPAQQPPTAGQPGTAPAGEKAAAGKPADAADKPGRPGARREPARPVLRLHPPATVLLSAYVPQIEFRETPFRQALEQLADIAGTNIFVKWNRLTELGVDPDAPITFRARHLPFGQILREVLRQGAPEGVRLAYRASRGMIVVSTVEEFNESMIVRTYDIEDIVMPHPRYPGAFYGRVKEHVISNEPVVARGAVGVRPITEVINSGTEIESENPEGYDHENEDEADQQRARNIQELIGAIHSTVEPDSWDVNGGRGTIRVFRGRLIIRNSPLVHQMIGGAVRE